MPTYEYRCERCGDTVEVVQSFTDSPLTECTSCGGPLRKVFAPVGIVFKGSGFYKTDSRSTSSATKRASSSESPSTSSDAKGTAGDGKGADKKDGKGADKKEAKADVSSSSSKGDGASTSSASSSPATTGAKKD
jgi:putative FmdB family regulatory protein